MEYVNTGLTRFKKLNHAILALLLFGALSYSTASYSAVIEADLFNTGDALLTKDTSNGLYWLDVTLNVGMSYNDVLALTQPGGIYEGFRYATEAEFEALILSAGLIYAGTTFPADQDKIDNAIALINMLGRTFDYSTEPFARLYGFYALLDEIPVLGNYANDPNFRRHATLQRQIYPSGLEDIEATTLTFDSFHIDFPYPAGGHLLVSNVPIPAAIWLFGSGLIGLIGIARRKKK